MLNIVVLVSGGGTNLGALISAQTDGQLNGGAITAVVSSRPEVYALKRAQDAKIDTYVVPRKQFDSIDSYGDAMLKLMDELKPDLIVQAGFLSILSARFCERYSGKIMNIHPSLLPKYGGKGMYGLHVHRAVLEHGESQTGATVHMVTGEVDGGPIIAQKTVPVMEGDTPEVLQRRVMEQAEHVLLPQAVRDFIAGKI